MVSGWRNVRKGEDHGQRHGQVREGASNKLLGYKCIEEGDTAGGST